MSCNKKSKKPKYKTWAQEKVLRNTLKQICLNVPSMPNLSAEDIK